MTLRFVGIARNITNAPKVTSISIQSVTHARSGLTLPGLSEKDPLQSMGVSL